jgi:hypothetical protein
VFAHRGLPLFWEKARRHAVVELNFIMPSHLQMYFPPSLTSPFCFTAASGRRHSDLDIAHSDLSNFCLCLFPVHSSEANRWWQFNNLQGVFLLGSHLWMYATSGHLFSLIFEILVDVGFLSYQLQSCILIISWDTFVLVRVGELFDFSLW